MKVENQVCSLEQAKKLKELGVKQDSVFYHYSLYESPTEKSFGVGFGEYDKSDPAFPVLYVETTRGAMSVQEDLIDTYSAFTVAELGEMLPCRIWIGDSMYELSLTKADNSWHKIPTGTKTGFCYEYQFVNQEDKIEILSNFQSSGESEAQARAAMLIHLKENNLLP